MGRPFDVEAAGYGPIRPGGPDCFWILAVGNEPKDQKVLRCEPRTEAKVSDEEVFLMLCEAEIAIRRGRIARAEEMARTQSAA